MDAVAAAADALQTATGFRPLPVRPLSAPRPAPVRHRAKVVADALANETGAAFAAPVDVRLCLRMRDYSRLPNSCSSIRNRLMKSRYRRRAPMIDFFLATSEPSPA